MKRSRLLPALLLAAAAALPPAARAQQPSISIPAPQSRPSVRGVVVDAASGRPVAGAAVRLERARLRVGTDSAGAFAMRRAPAGTQLLHVTALGYEPAMQLVAVPADGGVDVRIPLTAGPIALEGLRVVADRLEARRRTVPLSSRVIPEKAMALSSAPTMQDFLAQHVNLRPTPCHALASLQRTPAGSLQGECHAVRGAATHVGLYLDDAPLIGGWGSLRFYDPAEFGRVEVYRGGAILHLYTVAYLERAARRPDYAPQAFLF